MYRNGKLACDGEDDCVKPVTHVDHKGYAYCAWHGAQRKASGVNCRKLRPAEVRKLEGGQAIRY